MRSYDFSPCGIGGLWWSVTVRKIDSIHLKGDILITLMYCRYPYWIVPLSRSLYSTQWKVTVLQYEINVGIHRVELCINCQTFSFLWICFLPLTYLLYITKGFIYFYSTAMVTLSFTLPDISSFYQQKPCTCIAFYYDRVLKSLVRIGNRIWIKIQDWRCKTGIKNAVVSSPKPFYTSNESLCQEGVKHCNLYCGWSNVIISLSCEVNGNHHS